jgi:hypothetical protein
VRDSFADHSVRAAVRRGLDVYREGSPRAPAHLEWGEYSVQRHLQESIFYN